MDPSASLQVYFEKIGGRPVACLDGTVQPDLVTLRQIISTDLALCANVIRHSERQREWILSRLLILRFAGYIPDKGDHGELLWGEGHSGSLTHKKGHVALAFETGFADCDDPGIDLELVRRLDDELALKVVNAYEMEIASQIGPAWSTAVFSAKESIFKCLFRQVGFRFYFEAAQLVDVCAAAHQGIMMFRMTRALGPNVAHNTLVRVDYKRITLGSEEFWLTSARRK